MVLNRSADQPPRDGGCQVCEKLPGAEWWHQIDEEPILIPGQNGSTTLVYSIWVCDGCFDRVVLIDGRLVRPGRWGRICHAADAVNRGRSTVWQWARVPGSKIRMVRLGLDKSATLYNLEDVHRENDDRPRAVGSER